MKITVTGRHLDMSDPYHKAVEDGLRDVAHKNGIDPIDVTVVLSKEHHEFHTDMTTHLARHINIRVSAVGDDPYSSLTNALDLLTQRLRRHKKRVIDHHKHRDVHLEKSTVHHFVVNGSDSHDQEADEHFPAVIAETKLDIHKMSVADAVMRLDLSQESVFIFTNSKNDHLNVVYRRPDGNIAWVDPKFA